MNTATYCRLIRRWLAASAFGSVALSCAHAPRALNGLNVSNERSDYSPVLGLAVEVPLQRIDSGSRRHVVLVRIDSGFVEARGDFASSAPVVMRYLRLSALLARFPSGADSNGVRREPWTELARSAPIALADSLRAGERSHLNRFIELSIPVSPEVLQSANGVVFEVSGAAMSIFRGPLVGSGRGEMPLLVYACSTFDTRGRIQLMRLRMLSDGYSKAC